MKKIMYLLILIILPIIVNAKSYTAEDLTIDINDNWMVFTRDNIDNNEDLSKLGVDSATLKAQMNTYGMYIDAITTVDGNNYVETFLFIKDTDEEAMNLHKYKDEDIKDMGEIQYNKYNPEVLDIYKTNRYSYIMAQYQDKVNGNILYVLDYYTVINNKGYTIKSQSPAPFSDEVKSTIERMIISISFKVDKKYEKSPYKSKIPTIIICAVVGGVLGGIMGGIKNKKKAGMM